MGEHGNYLLKLKRYSEAESRLLEAHGLLVATLGPEHRPTVKIVGQLVEL